jgi:hypothetical protein
MTEEQIQREIRLDKLQMQMWKGQMDQGEIDWKLARIAELKAMLPQARHQDKVKAFGWKSVERNA